jgi:hypothetical protein
MVGTIGSPGKIGPSQPRQTDGYFASMIGIRLLLLRSCSI